MRFISDIQLTQSDKDRLQKAFCDTSDFSQNSPLAGRGTVSRFSLSTGSVVFRPYLRGGFIRHFVKSCFLSIGSNRAEVEFDVLKKLRKNGVRVPKVIAALVQSTIPFLYKAALVTEEVKDAPTLSEQILSATEDNIQGVFENAYRAGIEASRALDEGVHHPDLHPGNVLCAASGVYLIDFDKSKKVSSGSKLQLKERWARGVAKLDSPYEKVLCEMFNKGLGSRG